MTARYALALKGNPPVVEFRRCSGHCCDPVTLPHPPREYSRGVQRGVTGDYIWVLENLVYLGWRPPSKSERYLLGTHEYRCKHFDRKNRRCIIYGQDRRPDMCKYYPEYDDTPWGGCSEPGCTRRLWIIEPTVKLRWQFPDLWREDEQRKEHNA